MAHEPGKNTKMAQRNRRVLLGAAVALVAIVTVLQFVLFPCNSMPGFSVATGVIAGGALVGAIAFLPRRGLESKVLGVVALGVMVAAGFFNLFSHMCP